MSELLEEIPTTAKGPGASRVRVAVLIAACGLSLVAYIHRIGFALGAPEIKRDLGFDDAQLGALIAAFFWAYGGFQVVGGWLGDRFGARHTLTLLVLAWSLVMGAVALVIWIPGKPEQVADLVALRFLLGMLQAGAFPILSRVIADWIPVTGRGTAQGLIWMSGRLGGALTPLALGPLFAACGTWRTPFWLLMGVGVAWCAAFWPWFRDTPETSPRVNKAELARIAAGRTPRAEARPPIPWALLFGSRSAWALCLAYGCLGFSGNFFIGWLPSYLRSQRHLSADTTKWLTSLPMACGLFACLAGGALSDLIIRRTGNRSWGRRLTGAVGMGLAALAFAATIRVETPWLLGVLLCLTFACNDLAMAPAWAACADIGEQAAGTLGGLMNTMANLGGAVGAMIAGRLFAAHRPELAFLIFAASYALGALCWLGVDADRPLIAAPIERMVCPDDMPL